MKLFIAQTIDGFIADENGSLGHLKPFHGNDYGYNEHLASVSAVVLGRKTFEKVVAEFGWQYPAHLPGVIMTSRPLPPNVPSNLATATDPKAVATRYPSAYLDGGGETIRRFVDEGLISEARIFTLPILLGRGIRLFPPGQVASRRWTLMNVKRFPCDTVCHHYLAGRP